MNTSWCGAPLIYTLHSRMVTCIFYWSLLRTLPGVSLPPQHFRWKITSLPATELRFTLLARNITYLLTCLIPYLFTYLLTCCGFVARRKFSVNSEDTVSIVLEDDGTCVDEEEYFQFGLEPNSVLMLLRTNELWTGVRHIFGFLRE